MKFLDIEYDNLYNHSFISTIIMYINISFLNIYKYKISEYCNNDIYCYNTGISETRFGSLRLRPRLKMSESQ